MVSAFENGRAGQDRPQWAQVGRDLSWPEAEWQLSGNRKRKRTFDGWSQVAQFGQERTDAPRQFLFDHLVGELATEARLGKGLY
jgi:hypothetical protein